MYIKNLREIQTQTQEILFWLGPCDLRPVPKQPAWDFPYPDFVTLKINSLYTTWQNNLCQICTTLLYTKKTIFLYASSQYQEDNLIQYFSLSDYKITYKPWDLYVIMNKDSYRWTLRILH